MNTYCTNDMRLKQQGLQATITNLCITFEEADDITKEALKLDKDTSIYVSLKVSRDTPLLLLQQVIMDWQGNLLYLNKTYINTCATEYSMLINRTTGMSGGSNCI